MLGVIDGTNCPARYSDECGAFVTSLPDSVLARLGQRRVIGAVRSLLNSEPDLFRIEYDANGDEARILIRALPHYGWFVPTDWEACNEVLSLMGRRPTDSDHEFAVYAVAECQEPAIRSALLGVNPINRPKGFSGDWPIRINVTADSPFGPVQTSAWVWRIARRIQVEDAAQIGLTLTDCSRRRCEMFFRSVERNEARTAVAANA